jgi:hypothetical protein
MDSAIGEFLTLIIRDPDTGEKITVKYRRPFTRERLRYALDLWDPEKKTYRPDEEIDQLRINWGQIMIQGIEMTSGNDSLISSDPDSKSFRKDWRDWIMEKAPQILETLAFKAFQGIDLSRAIEEEAPEKKS